MACQACHGAQIARVACSLRAQRLQKRGVLCLRFRYAPQTQICAVGRRAAFKGVAKACVKPSPQWEKAPAVLSRSSTYS